jgi:hypothetical protein
MGIQRDRKEGSREGKQEGRWMYTWGTGALGVMLREDGALKEGRREGGKEERKEG